MIETMHRDLTERVALALGYSEAEARLLAKYAAFPDGVGDTRIDGRLARIARRLNYHPSRLAHFQRPGNKGWALDADPNVAPINLPDRRVSVDVYAWAEVVPSAADRARHPLAVQLARPGAETAADEIVFPSAADMADWLARSEGNSLRRAGCALHFLQDCCVEHHARGTLFGGHAEFEALMAEEWRTGRWGGWVKRALRDAARDKARLHPRAACISAAKMARRHGETLPTIRRAIRYTAAVLRWWEARR